MSEASDEALARRAQAGDGEAFVALVHRHAAVAHRVAALLAGSWADGEDAAQDALVKAYQALPTYDPGRPFRPWLLAIVANTARNRRRAGVRRLRYELAVPQPGAAASAEDAVLAAERRRALLALVEALPEHERLVVACRHLLELSEAETSAALGIPPGTVKSRLSRARAHLAAALTADAAEEARA